MSEVIERPMTPPARGAETAQAVLDIVNAYPNLHNQAHFEFKHACGTARCIAGWAIYLHYGEVYSASVEDMRMSGKATIEIAAPLLGLSEMDDVIRLFRAGPEDVAVAALKYLANGEAIEWNEILKK
jgi:hypothetical protein